MKRARRSSSAARPCTRTTSNIAQWKPLVESLVRAQQQLCNRFLSEAEALIKKLNPTDGSNVTNAAELEHEIGLLLFRVKTGQPKSEGLMKVLENPENLKLMNQAELDLHTDQKKVDLYRGEGRTALRH